MRKITFLVFVLFLFLCQQVFSAVDPSVVADMKKLYAAAGPIPKEIIAPPSPMTKNLPLSSRLSYFWRENILGFRITRSSARGKACFANQRVILGAVEMYNMDHTTMLEKISDGDVAFPSGLLVVEKCLVSPVIKPEVSCEYASYGKLTEYGIIYCKTHGTLEHYREALAQVAGIKLPEEREAELIPFILLGTAVLIFLPLAFIFLRNRGKEATPTCNSTS